MLDDLKAALKLYIARQSDRFGVIETPIPGMVISHAVEQHLPGYAIYRPALGVVVQGAKQVWLGEQVLDYREGEALLVSVSVLAKGVITRANSDTPFIGMSIELDIGILREVSAFLGMQTAPLGRCLSVHILEPEVVDCLRRLARLLEDPEGLSVLYPGLMRELSYRLLKGPAGPDLRSLSSLGGPSNRIERALMHLRSGFAGPVRVEDLAATAGMSVSSFHRYFKALTKVTPKQYQKQLRLIEARRIMDAGADNVTGAAIAVGYESPAHFSRDYSRFFGVSPKRDTLSRRLGT